MGFERVSMEVEADDCIFHALYQLFDPHLVERISNDRVGEHIKVLDYVVAPAVSKDADKAAKFRHNLQDAIRLRGEPVPERYDLAVGI